jgi:hypothetical protein
MKKKLRKKYKTVWIRIPRPPKIYKKVVLVKFDNCAPFVYVITSRRSININRIAAYFERTEGFNEDRDSITIVGEVGEIAELNIDRKVKE